MASTNGLSSQTEKHTTMPIFFGIELSRGLAALMVLLCHYAYMLSDVTTVLTFLWTGVDLFFVISGFVFGRPILSSAINPGYFFTRRFFRIYPLYLVALMAYFLLAPAAPEKFDYFLHHLGFLQTLQSKQEAFYFNPAFWSLPVEVEYYLFVPILAYLIRLRTSLLAIFMFSLIGKSWILLQAEPGVKNIYAIMGFHLPAILPEFLMGLILYKAVIWGQGQPNPLKRSLSSLSFLLGALLINTLAMLFIHYGDAGIKSHRVLGGFYNLLCALGYAFLLFPMALIQPRSTAISGRLMMAIGSISYPVYLLHNASPKLLDLAGIKLAGTSLFIACLVLTVVVSIAAHRYVEEPARLYGRRLSMRIRQISRLGA